MLSSLLFRRSAPLLAALLLTSPAAAWDISVGTGFLADSFYILSTTGSGGTQTTVGERVFADDQPGPTINNNWTTRTWDGIAWSSEDFTVFDGVTQGSIFHNAVEDEFWDSAEAFVFGSVSVGNAAGAGFGYDFELVVNPFSSVTLFLDGFETFLYMEAQPGDVGTAFAQMRLYSTDVDINDPGGANMPWARDLYSIQAGDPVVIENPSFSADFTNSTGSPVTYQLRLDGRASVFALPVPEPAHLLLLGCAGLGLAWRRRA